MRNKIFCNMPDTRTTTTSIASFPLYSNTKEHTGILNLSKNFAEVQKNDTTRSFTYKCETDSTGSCRLFDNFSNNEDTFRSIDFSSTSCIFGGFMVMNNVIKVRVSKSQLGRLKMDAEAKGFLQLARYIRYIALERNQHIESKILENNRILRGIEERE